MSSALTEREREVLAFEGQWWQRAGAKEQAIADLFGVTPTRYYQQLQQLIQRPEALAAEPVTVNRLRDLVGRRQQQRSERRTA